MKNMKLYLLGTNEIFGLEEVISGIPKRNSSVRCTINNSVIFFIKKEDFINCINFYKFGDKVL